MKEIEKIIKENIEKYGLPILKDEKTDTLQWIDIRELKLRYFISIEKTKPFFDGLREGKLLATKCSNCEKLFFPPQNDCPHCLKSELDWVELSKKGILETWTSIYVRPPSFSSYDIYMVGIVMLDEGVRITGWLKGNSKKVYQGQRVSIEINKREKEGYFMYEIVPQE